MSIILELLPKISTFFTITFQNNKEMPIVQQIGVNIENDLFKGKVIVILGARQVGKSILNGFCEFYLTAIYTRIFSWLRELRSPKRCLTY